jgi:3',5'-cyclic AMP phosphodiesterase CpdA
MLIAQITDLHLGFHSSGPTHPNRARLKQVLGAIAAMRPAPHLLLVTGDLVDARGGADSYRLLKGLLDEFPLPSALCIGNHDRRDLLARTFPETPITDNFVQYAIEHLPVRILALDTAEEGRHGGNLCEARLRWLAERLAEAPERPTVIALHHPPIATGLSWMTESPAASWVVRLGGVVGAHPNVVALLSGHLHRPLATRWAGTMLAVCPPTAAQTALDFAPLDPEQPDGRPMIVAAAPGYAIHHWNGNGLVTHFADAGANEVIARFDAGMQPLVRRLVEERRERGANEA